MFSAREDEVVEGLVVRAGEQIVLDVPSSESSRASARGVREAAGDSLLGIRLFSIAECGIRIADYPSRSSRLLRAFAVKNGLT